MVRHRHVDRGAFLASLCVGAICTNPCELSAADPRVYVATAYAVADFAAFMAAVATFSVKGVFAYIGPFHVAALAASLCMYWSTLVCDEQPTWGRFVTFLIFSPLAVWRPQRLVSEGAA